MKLWIVKTIDGLCGHRIMVPWFLTKKLGYGCFMGAWAVHLSEIWDIEEY